MRRMCLPLLGFVAAFGAARTARADVASVEAYGLSAHLGASYADAPRRMDANGVYVLNPGLGVEWDFRARTTKTGFSPILKVGWLQDCDDRPVYAALGGVRYTRVLSSRFTIGGSVSLGIVNGEDWDTGERHNALMPLPVIEIGHAIGAAHAARLGIIYVPPSATLSATDNNGLLFITAAFGRSIE